MVASFHFKESEMLYQRYLSMKEQLKTYTDGNPMVGVGVIPLEYLADTL
jgi:hypothetical protein